MKRITLVLVAVALAGLAAMPSHSAKPWEEPPPPPPPPPTCAYFKTPQNISPDFLDGQLFKATWSLKDRNADGTTANPAACVDFTYSLYLLRTQPDAPGASAPEVIGYTEQRGDGIHSQVRFAVRLAEPVTSVCAYLVSRDPSGVIVDELPHDPSAANEDVALCATHNAGTVGGSGGSSYN